jgi:hypothetical protein
MNTKKVFVYGEEDAKQLDFLRDGQTLRVPMQFLDALRPGEPSGWAPSHVGSALVTDAYGAPAGHGAGYCFLQLPSDERPAAYQDYQDRMVTGWKLDQLASAQRDSCGGSTADARESAYAAYEQRLANSWRKP